MSITFEDGVFVAPPDAPYAEELKAAFWRHNERRWYTEDLERVLPVAQYLSDDLLKKLQGAQQDSSYDMSVALEPSADFTVPVPAGRQLFPYQLASAEFIDKHPNTLLAEDAGMGKSAIMLAVANKNNYKRILILCPAVAKFNWLEKEWKKWSTLTHLSIGVAEGSEWPNTDVVIINYDILQRHKRAIQAIAWDYLIVDESHRIKNIEAKRTIFVLGGTMKLKEEDAVYYQKSRKKGYYKIPPIVANKRVFASATPMNRPKDLWTICLACDPQGLGSNWMTFHRRYCDLKKTPFGQDINGSSNLAELGARMRSKFMVRHNPDEVLNLPPLREEIFLLPPVKVILTEEENFVHDNIDALLNLAKRTGDTEIGPNSSAEAFLRLIGEVSVNNMSIVGEPDFKPLFSKFALIREQTGIAKVPYVAQFVRDITDDLSLPIVVFAYHRSVMELLREEFPESAYIIGGMKAEARNDQVDLFQEGKVNVFLGNIDAAGEAITLTRASLLVFAEWDWRGTAMIQARKRIHRISQDQPCTVYYTASAKSFDSLVADSALEKMENIKQTLLF